MRVTAPLMFRQGLGAITNAQAQAVKTQNQLARGTRIVNPSDDPVGSKRLLDLQQSLRLNEQFQSNANAAETRLSLEESTLNAVNGALLRVRELAIQANSDTLTSNDRAAIGVEVAHRLEEIVALANTKDGNNEFLFAGLTSGTKPFIRSNTGITFTGDQGARSLALGPELTLQTGDSGAFVFQDIQNGNGRFSAVPAGANTGTGSIDPGSISDAASFVSGTFSITFPTPDTFEVRDAGATLINSGAFSAGDSITFAGHEVRILGGPAAGDVFNIAPSIRQGVFDTVDNLRQTLTTATNSPSAEANFHSALNKTFAELDQAIEHISTVRSSVGARLNVAENERNLIADFNLQVKTSISDIEDLDIAEAITRLNQQLTVVEAAQRSFATIQQLSLFNFI